MSIRWGILGCGDVCEVKSGPALQQARGSELRAVMRRDRAKAEDFARRHGVPRFYDDADELIADPEVDAVYVATPPGSHLELALRVAAAGKPAYVEKPMARTHQECLRLLAAFEAAQQPLFVAYYRRALPRFLKARELLSQLGAVSRIHVRYASNGQGRHRGTPSLPWRLQAEHAGGGLFMDLASHTLDVLDFLFGPLEDVDGRASRSASLGAGNVEDTVELTFRTTSGALGSGSWTFIEPAYEDRITITGERGSLTLATFGDGPLTLELGGEPQQHTLQNPKHIQLPLVQTIVDSLRGQGTCPSTGLSAARTSAVLDRALLGYYGSRDDGFWRAPERWPGLSPVVQ